jgi:hypothetical protein
VRASFLNSLCAPFLHLTILTRASSCKENVSARRQPENIYVLKNLHGERFDGILL